MSSKKMSVEEEVASGLRHLAFGNISDAITLLFADDETILEKIPSLDLFNISEIKRPKGGGMEIKFFDRIKALEKLCQVATEKNDEPVNFYKALEESAKKLSGEYGNDEYE